MLNTILYFLTLIHFITFGCLGLYGIHRIWLLLQLKNERKKCSEEIPSFNNNHPFVTIQLPIYNEKFVAGRLIDAASKINWPKDRLEIQILDDSTDDTRNIIDKSAEYWGKKGLNINVIRRNNRNGFKAGALSNGLKLTKGEFIAIFDADFIPEPDFLYRTIPYFSNKNIGMIQTRWSFLNASYSWLTKIQSIFLGQHFSIEHFIRYRKGLFFNFNGTAGIWRKIAIESSGGWQSDTVTEDLDLSYRAQMAGWKFIYLENISVPSELPVTISDFRSQQQRWAKGSIQTAKKILPQLIFSNTSGSIKKEAIAHLMANLCWLLGTIATLTLYPAIIYRKDIGINQILHIDLPLFIFSSFTIFIYFFLFNKMNSNKIESYTLFLLPVLTVGIAPSISLSVLKGIFSKGGDFCRTPKYGFTFKNNISIPLAYKTKSYGYIILNMILFFYSLLPLIFAVKNNFVAVPFLLIFPLGFGLIFLKEINELKN
jgi:cellulose synthase/poly-beta-1,6-N-acetylglucosamine synthase-like glycosyltransferase